MKRRGSSIFETIIYVALFVIIMGMLVTFLVNILRRTAKEEAMLEVNQNTLFAIDKASAVIRSAINVTDPADGATGSSLTLTMADLNLSPTVIAVTNGVLTMRQGTGAAVPLTSSGISITGFTVKNLVNSSYHLRTEPIAVPCQENQNKRLICHGGNTQCVSKNSKLAEGDSLGPCYSITTAKPTIQLTLTAAAIGSGEDYQATQTLYGSATIPRQN
jgi:hypothetical protein